MTRYRNSVHGVFEISKNSRQRLTYTSCRVIAHSRDASSDAWGAVLKWRDRDGVIHKQAFPLCRFHEPVGVLAGELANMGLAIVPGRERHFMRYLASSQPELRYCAATHVGWQDSGVFVLPTGTIGVTEERVIYQPERHAPTSLTVRQAGSLDDWKDRVAARISGNPLLIFWTSAALSAPLLHLLGLEAGGFHLYGETSSGKTTAEQVAASVWGDGSDPAGGQASAYVRRWNLTKNASEGLAEAHNDLPLLLDEVSEAEARDFGRMIYQLAGGQGKARLSRDATLKKPRVWRVMLLSTGEIPTADVIESEGKYLRGGQAVRLINIPVINPDSGRGLIRNTAGETSPASYVDSLKLACSQVYGTAGPAFIEALIEEGLNHVRNELQQSLMESTEALTPEGGSPEVGRAVKRIALVAVAGEKAQSLGIVPWEAGEALRAAKVVTKRFLAARNGHGRHTDGAVETIRSFILTHGSSRFRALKDENAQVIRLAGYREGETFYFTADGFKEACRGHNLQDVARMLKRRGLLRAPDEGHLMERVLVPGLGRVRLYAVSTAIVDEDGRTGETT